MYNNAKPFIETTEQDARKGVPMLGGTDLLTPYSRVILEKLTGYQLVKKFPAFCGTPRFITALTSARHLAIS